MARRTVLRAVRCGEGKRLSLLCSARWAECEAVGAAAAGGETEHAANRTPTRRPPGRPAHAGTARRGHAAGSERDRTDLTGVNKSRLARHRDTRAFAETVARPWPAQPVRGQGSARQAALETSSRVTDACTACGSSAIYLIYYALGALPCTVAFLCRCQRAFFSHPLHTLPYHCDHHHGHHHSKDLHPTSEHTVAPCLTRSHQRPQPRTSHTCGA